MNTLGCGRRNNMDLTTIETDIRRGMSRWATYLPTYVSGGGEARVQLVA